MNNRYLDNATLSPTHANTTLSEKTAKIARAILKEGESSNTTNSYASAIRYWQEWHALRQSRPLELPLDVNSTLLFITDHLLHQSENGVLEMGLPIAIDKQLVKLGVKNKEGPLSIATIDHRLAAIAKAHSLYGYPSPTEHGAVKELLTKARRAYARRGQLSQSKDALTRDLLMEVVEVCEADESLAGIRDKALLLFGWASGGRRRSEIANANMAFLTRYSDTHYTYILGHSKSNQSGQRRGGDIKPVKGMAAQALCAWLNAAKIQSGPIFRRINRGDRLNEQALTPAGVNHILQKRFSEAGLEGNFSAHSLRSGFITEAGRQNAPISEVMAMSGHSSTRTFMGYFQAGALSQSKAASLLEDE